MGYAISSVLFGLALGVACAKIRKCEVQILMREINIFFEVYSFVILMVKKINHV